jgi:hypothetical protein
MRASCAPSFKALTPDPLVHFYHNLITLSSLIDNGLLAGYFARYALCLVSFTLLMSTHSPAGEGGSGGGGQGPPVGSVPTEIQLVHGTNDDHSRHNNSSLSSQTMVVAPSGITSIHTTTSATTRPDPDGWSVVDYLRARAPVSNNNNSYNNNSSHRSRTGQDAPSTGTSFTGVSPSILAMGDACINTLNEALAESKPSDNANDALPPTTRATERRMPGVTTVDSDSTAGEVTHAGSIPSLSTDPELK